MSPRSVPTPCGTRANNSPSVMCFAARRSTVVSFSRPTRCCSHLTLARRLHSRGPAEEKALSHFVRELISVMIAIVPGSRCRLNLKRIVRRTVRLVSTTPERGEHRVGVHRCDDRINSPRAACWRRTGAERVEKNTARYSAAIVAVSAVPFVIPRLPNEIQSVG